VLREDWEETNKSNGQRMNTIHLHAWKKWLRYTVAVGALHSAILSTVPAFADEGERDAKTATPIRHVVVIIQENRTFDNYFGTYPKAANIPGEQSWIGVPAPKFTARDDTPKVNGLTPELLKNNPNRSLTGGPMPTPAPPTMVTRPNKRPRTAG
jgi:hypothetical protein